MRVGLRIDVDTYRGTRRGVPRLLAILEQHGIHGSFFFTVGPDNMGRHLSRLLRPAFLVKMLRSKAASLYGWDILLRGTIWPGPVIGEKLGDVIREAERAGHEIGYHAFDHHAWQTKIEKMDAAAVRRSLARGIGALTKIIGRAPDCSATAGWKTTDDVLREKDRFPFRYHSDCRGDRIFRPLLGYRELSVVQVPVTLPTYDEAVNTDQCTAETFFSDILSLLDPDGLNVFTIHAEAEGIVLADAFDEFLTSAATRGIDFGPLSALIPDAEELPGLPIVRKEIPGREGWVACQEETVSR